jgi:hypothetical protein
MDTERNQNQSKFPLWTYLTQPLFSPEFKSLNPIKFWRLYRAEQLETCWSKHMPEPRWIENPTHFLESCWSKNSDGSDLLQDPDTVKFLEGCWDQEFPQIRNRLDGAQDYRDESEEYY